MSIRIEQGFRCTFYPLEQKTKEILAYQRGFGITSRFLPEMNGLTRKHRGKNLDKNRQIGEYAIGSTIRQNGGILRSRFGRLHIKTVRLGVRMEKRSLAARRKE